MHECHIRSWCQLPSFAAGQHYKVNMSVHCHKWVPIMIWPFYWYISWLSRGDINCGRLIFTILVFLVLTCPILIMLCTSLGNDKYLFLNSSAWLDQGLNAWGSDPMSYQNGRWTLNSFGHPVWYWKNVKLRQPSLVSLGWKPPSKRVETH